MRRCGLDFGSLERDAPSKWEDENKPRDFEVLHFEATFSINGELVPIFFTTANCDCTSTCGKKLQTRVTEYSVRSISLIGSDIFTLLVVVSVLYAFDALDGDREEHDLRDLYIPGDTNVDHVVFSNCTD